MEILTLDETDTVYITSTDQDEQEIRVVRVNRGGASLVHSEIRKVWLSHSEIFEKYHNPEPIKLTKIDGEIFLETPEGGMYNLIDLTYIVNNRHSILHKRYERFDKTFRCFFLGNRKIKFNIYNEIPI